MESQGCNVGLPSSFLFGIVKCMKHMIQARHILLIDRSLLSLNLFRLLLAPFEEIHFLAREKLDDNLTAFLEQQPLHMLIINSNVFVNHFEENLHHLRDHPQLASLPKIFLCREKAKEQIQYEMLSNLENAKIVFRPFDLETLRHIIQQALEERKTQ